MNAELSTIKKSAALPPGARLLAMLVVIGSLAAAFAQTEPPPAPGVRSLEYPRWHTPEPDEFKDYNQRASLVQRGREVYNTYCVGCHGESGDGNGPAAKRLITKPRDFTKGIFKFRSTETNLPLDSDLYRTITRGLPRVSMPAFPLMPERDKLAVIQYVKSFYPNWEQDAAKIVVVPVPRAPQDLREKRRAERGNIVYIAAGCAKCHGVDGQGANATLKEYTDAWGHPQKPFNFTRGRLKGGDDPEDIYRTFRTGLLSVMPTFGGVALAAPSREVFKGQESTLLPGQAEALKGALEDFPATTKEVYETMSPSERQELAERNSWDLVSFILSLHQDTSTAAAVIGADAQPSAPSSAQTATPPAATGDTPR